MTREALLATLLAVALGASVGPSADEALAADPPAGFKRYFPKGRFPALDAPAYVPAAAADTPADAWVLGVVIDSQARAYELNLLTRHEVINDRVGDRPVAVVWCPLANSAAVYDRRVGGRVLSFEPSGVLLHGSIVVQDRETESFWPLLHEKALYGPLEGVPLARVPGVVRMRFADWVRAHPETLVWSLYGQEHLAPNPMMRYLASSQGYRGLSAEDRRLATKEPVFGFVLDGTPHAVAAADLEGGRVFAVAGGWVLLHRPPGGALQDATLAFRSARGFAREEGAWQEAGASARLDVRRGAFSGPDPPAAVEGFDTFWYVWSLNHPGTVLLGR